MNLKSKIISGALLATLALTSFSRASGACDSNPTIEPYVKAVKNAPKNLDYQYNLAVAYYKVIVSDKNPQESPCLDDCLDAFKRFIKAGNSAKRRDETMADAYSVLGILLFQFKADNKGGLEAFKKALEIRPKDKESLYGAALTLKNLGKEDEAVEYLKKTIAADPTNGPAYSTLATLLDEKYRKSPNAIAAVELKKAYEGAVRTLEANKKANAENLVFCYNRLSELYDKSNDVPKAISVLSKAIELQPDNVNAHALLGIMYSRDKNYLKMVEQYEKAVELDPNLEQARFNLAVAYIYQEQYAKAYEQFSTIIEKINPNSSEILALQGQTLGQAIAELNKQGGAAITAEDYLGAKNIFERVLKMDPKDTEAKKYYEQSQEKLETKFAEYKANAKKLLKGTKAKRVQAAELVEKALALKPDDAETLVMKDAIKNEMKDLVKLYLDKGDKAMLKRDYHNAEDNYKKAANYPAGKQEAEAKLKRLGTKFKGEFDAAMRKAKAALAKGDLDSARNEFRNALAINTQDKNANAGLVQTNTKISEKIKKLTADGQSAFASDQKTKAKKSFDAVLALDASNATANDFIKRITGTVSKAKVNADEIKTLYYKGVDFYVNNQIQKAIDAWKQLLTLDPNHLDAKKNIERAQTKLAALNKLKG